MEKATSFEVPLDNVSHCTNAKNEVTLEFHQNDEAPVSLVELRFHIPTDPNSSVDPVQVIFRLLICCIVSRPPANYQNTFVGFIRVCVHPGKLDFDFKI